MATTNRRQLLTGAAAYAAGAAIVAGGAALASEAKGATIDHSAWTRAMWEYEQATAAIAAFTGPADQAHKRWQADEPSGNGIDFAVFWPRSREAVLSRLDPDEFEHELLARIGVTWRPTDTEKAHALAQVEALRGYHVTRKTNRARHNIDAVREREEALYDAQHDARMRLLQLPAPDADALAWKIAYLFDPNEKGYTDSFEHSYVKQTLADAVRLAGGTPAGLLA